MNIADLHIIGNSTIFYEGIKHYFIYPSNDSYTMTIEHIEREEINV